MEISGQAVLLRVFIGESDKLGHLPLYEAIVKGKHTLEPGLPESFNVLIKEMQALALNVELLEDEEELT